MTLYIKHNYNYYKGPEVSIKKRVVILFRQYQSVIND